MSCKRGMVRGVAIAVIAIAILNVLSVGGASAAETTDEDLIKQGVESRRRLDDAGALELFNRAYALRKSARAAGQIGFAELALGRWIEAEMHLEEALSASGDPWVRKNEAALRSSLERVRRQLGDLDVLGSPAGAEIVIEGQVRGTLPLAKPMRVRAGDCRIDVRAPGYSAVSRSVEITSGALTRETVNLSPLIGVPPTPRVATSEKPAGETAFAAPAGQAEPVATVRVPAGTASSESGSRGSGRRMIGVALGVAGVAAAGAGLGFGLAARSAGDTGSKATTFDPAADSRGHSYQTLQWVGYGAGAALIAGGVATFLLAGPRTGDQRLQKVAVAPVPDGGAIAFFGGRF